MVGRSPAPLPWRLAGLFACVAVGLLWASSQLLTVQNCQPERERAARAEDLAVRVHAQREQALERRVAELEAQLSKVHGKPRQDSFSEGSFQQTLVETLQAEVALLRGQKEELLARLRTATPQAVASAASTGRAELQADPPAPRAGSAPNGEVVVLAPPVPLGLQGALTASDSGMPGRVSEDNLRAAANRGAIGVVVISCKRPNYLRRSMESILKAARDPQQFPLVISQDAFDATMTEMIESTYVKQGVAFHMHHPHEPGAAKVAQGFGGGMALGYVRIADHFGFAMRRMFDDFGFQQVIFLEEDMEIAPDFFSYFSAMLNLLRADKDLFCVSAWNDNGYASLVQDPRAAYRTDFFPGLGWMMRKEMWAEVRDRWAVAYWDEFMRRPDVRKGRHCLRPEISRSFTFGEEGTSGGQFFSTHLQHIRLNSVAVDWSKEDLHHLSSVVAFDDYLIQCLRQATSVGLHDIDQHSGRGETLRIEYDDHYDYAHVAQKFSLMPDEKEGIRRMSYRGVIPFAWQGNRVYLHTRQWPGNIS